MALEISITIAGTDFTHLVDKDSFPEYFDEGFKGDGYFDFQVEPFTFKVITLGSTVKPARGDWVVITNTRTAGTLLRGKIDEIQDDETPLPEITVFPQALLWKDTIIGDAVELSVGEPIKEYSVSNRHVRAILNDLITTINTEHSTEFWLDEDSVPDQVNTGLFFSEKMKEIGGKTFGQRIMAWLLYTDDLELRWRDENDTLYLLFRDGDIHDKTIVSEGAWLDYTYFLSIPLTDITISLGPWVLPPSDFTIPWLTTKYNVWKVTSSGLEWVEQFETNPGFYGEFVSQNETTTPYDKFISFAESQGMIGNDDVTLEVVQAWQIDDLNEFAIVTGTYKDDPAETYKMLISYEAVFDDTYSAVYRDKTASEIILDLAKAANRLFYIDREGKVYFIPRTTNRGSVNYIENNTLEASKVVKREPTSDVRINRYKEDSKGKVSTYGLKIREAQYEALVSYYRALFTGEITQRVLKMYRLEDMVETTSPAPNISGDHILKEINWDHLTGASDIGIVIKMEHSFLEPITRVTVEL